MRYILTQSITIPAGTEFEPVDDPTPGGLRFMRDRGFMIVYLGRAGAMSEGMITMRQDGSHLKLVE